jgi:hypothetical protein
VKLAVRITNHAPVETSYRVQWHLPEGWKQIGSTGALAIAPRADGALTGTFRVPSAGLHVITASVLFGDRRLHEWVEALVRVK